MCKKLVHLTSFVLVLFLASNAFSVDDPSDMADSSGDIKHIEAWVEDGNLHLTMTVYGIFAPSAEDTPAGMKNRYYYHWLLDTDNNPDTGYLNNEYEGNSTNLETPIGIDILIQFGWRDGATAGVYAYTLDMSTGDEVELFEDYEYTIDGDTIHAVIPLEDLGLNLGQTIAVSAYQEGASNDWQVDWLESFELTLTAIEKTVLFAEDFEGLVLGPNIDEAVAGDAVWTDTPPEGWIVDESSIPGIGMDATDGVTEWAGWAFADKAWWVEAAGDQDRSLFELGSGIVAVADPDEWDDDERLPIPITADPYDTWLTTPAIDIAKAEAGTLELKFDSSWRPEFDDNLHQTANITASFDGGEPVVVMLWESDEASDNYKPYATNETVIVKLDKPEGARKLVLTFGLFDAGNDWWWAIDNIEVRAIVPDVNPVKPSTEGLIAHYALAGDANDSSGNGNDGTIYNAETGGLGDGGSVWVEDPERGTVISFNGTAAGAYVRAGEIPQMTLSNDFTWSFWAKQNAENTANNDIILGNRKDANAVDFVPRQFIKFTPTKFEWHMNGNGDDNLEYDDIPADIWLHHAVVKTGDQLTYYRNGVEASSGMITQALDFPQPLFFGGDNESAEGENWSGFMSEVCIYNRALSAGEVMYIAGKRATPVDPGTDGLAAYYALENDVLDGSGNGNDGTIVGASAFVDGPAGYGMAMEFDGESYVDCGNGASLDITGPISIGMWIKPGADDPEGQGTEAAAMAKADSAASPSWSWQVRYGWNSPQPYMAFTFNTSPRAWVYVGQNLEKDEWAHIACSADGETLKCYLNGEETDSTPMGAITSSPAPVLIGSDGWRSDWIGAIDEVVIYDRALSAGEIRYLAGIREYTFEGDALDDTWGHDNGSDAWDGTGPGEGSAGGIASLV
ncbi:MAG: LamG domain-containing protein, partial [Sedimentisphaerales bacterium]|nr:LamG domain-containing protein [Sedimentisphaerales bacterium]